MESAGRRREGPSPASSAPQARPVECHVSGPAISLTGDPSGWGDRAERVVVVTMGPGAGYNHRRAGGTLVGTGWSEL
eukprot:760348-Hanusia_phi.AAC.12